MLSLRNGAFEYGRQRLAFPDINIKPGETVGLYGPSGCGKSTLAQVLAGLVPHSHGVLSHPMKQTGVGSPVQWISQSPEFAFNPRWRLSRSLAESHNVTGQMLARYQVNPAWLKRLPSQLSGGELQRLNIVRALAPSTQYLICDEITAQLDAITQQYIWQVLAADIQQRHLGALVISHSYPLLNNVCDRVIKWPECIMG
ncbi:ATP-binding cassette domain-containing protein [Photobacterium sp. DA100]|uniref:ATP-binding cassette domain-containing protein n=1 Tax=Photobacterium sp. DA100 TaxID=3027472 RepID=UPI00247A9036|nr:ATP-binding cassette domain-containing protein [Photobacterium sp. DA100]WEM41187.1 ATP-binding cassette domain-containing protein [Photobacterium sp. DA100]